MATDTLTRPTIVGSATETKVFKNFIDGEWVLPHGEVRASVIDPSTEETTDQPKRDAKRHRQAETGQRQHQ